LLHGQGFVYNPGDRVLGTTTPLYTLLLAGLGLLGIDPTVSAVALGVAADLGVVAVLLVLGSRAQSWPAGAIAATLYGLLSPAVAYSVAGMETPLYTLSILVTVLAYVSGRLRLAFPLSLWHPEG
jgi:hypothetical protein